jgi:malonyl-CoA O-methyltransferase
MVLHWVTDPLAAIRELHRVLEPGALLLFSTLGPDSLKELRAVAGPRACMRSPTCTISATCSWAPGSPIR